MSNQVKYTPEPWQAQKPHSGNRGFEIADASGLNQVCQDLNEANARRIVACVNACAGIPTECLELGPEAVSITPIYQQLQHKRKELNEALGRAVILEIQRDQLLAALQQIADWPREYEVCEIARKAIAATKGGAA